jgi:hypothetical protein
VILERKKTEMKMKKKGPMKGRAIANGSLLFLPKRGQFRKF